MTEEKASSNRNALILLGLQFLSDFGDQIANALLALCLLDITKSTAQIGSVYLVTTLGYVIFTFLGGMLGDKFSRRKILVFADIGRGCVVLLMIVALHQQSISLIYLTSFLLSILDSLHRPVKLSAWTNCIPSTKLERFTSLSELSIQGSTIFGPLIASLFIFMNWKNLGFMFDALTFFMCAAVFSRIVAEEDRSIKSHEPKRDFFMGFKLIAKQSAVLKYVSYDAIQMIGFGAFNATFLVVAQRDFGFSKADYSYHLSIVAVFTVVGAILGATTFIAKIDPKLKLTVCALASSAAIFAVLQIAAFPISSILVGICDGLAVMTMAVTRTKVQLFAKAYHPRYLSSIIAARGLVIKAATLFGTASCLLLEDFMSLTSTLSVFAVPIALSCVPFFVDDKERQEAQRA